MKSRLSLFSFLLLPVSAVAAAAPGDAVGLLPTPRRRCEPRTVRTPPLSGPVGLDGAPLGR